MMVTSAKLRNKSSAHEEWHASLLVINLKVHFCLKKENE